MPSFTTTKMSGSEGKFPPGVFPIIELTPEMMLHIIGMVEEVDIDDVRNSDKRPTGQRTLISLSMTSKFFRERLAPRIFRTIVLLKRSEICNPDVSQFYAEIAQRNAFHNCDKFLKGFSYPPFWRSNSSLPGVLTITLADLMCNGKSRLRRLHIEGDSNTAMALHDNMERNRRQLVNLEEITIGLEMSFLLKYTLNVKPVSKKPYGGSLRPQNYIFRFRDFFARCRELPKLRTMELTVADLERSHGMAQINVPAIGLETFFGPDQSDCELIQMGFILKTIRTQPSLVEVHIPKIEDICIETLNDRNNLPCGEKYSNMLPASFIAIRAPLVKRVHVGRFSVVEIERNRAGSITLWQTLTLAPSKPRPSQDWRSICWHDRWDDWKEPIINMPMQNWAIWKTNLPLKVVHGDEEDRAAWIEEDAQGTAKFVVVDAACTRIDRID
ncbi:hypothetical protein IWZ03DRAFT_409686 [Phyllosticta citriasiana]|uniref:F-box domain-containing protein n=1 Tax=Phyllosticta citriasiana TaxID=595635 RepID=A0ABR1K8R7_9PEZI